MKNLSVLIGLLFFTSINFAQVSFSITAPASIAGGYEFTSNGDAPNWGLADLLDPNDAVMDTVVIVDDGTPGINAQGVPHANEGCNTLMNDLTGKIAFVYRYDGVSTNDCYAGTKVLNAQNAGAVGVILVNRTEGVFGYDGTTDGPSTSIPFAFISKSDGEIIRAKLDAGEDVVAFIGSKLGLYSNDVGIVKNKTLAPEYSAVPSLTAATGSEFGFDVGATIYNYGQNTQNDINITASVSGPGGTWTETAGPFTLASTDSIDVFTNGVNNIPAFSLSNYPTGVYNLDYTVTIGATDESDFDNNIEYEFVVSDSLFSYCKMDLNTMLPEANTFTRSNDANFSTCIVYDNANSSRLAAKGIHFSAGISWNSGSVLEGMEVATFLYKWNDNFTDLIDVNFAFDNLEDETFTVYQFGPNSQDQMVYVPFSENIQLEDNQRYLACIQTYDSDITIGYSTRTNYFQNVQHYLQPLFPVSSNSTYYGLGFGEERVPAIALSVFDATELAIESAPSFKFEVFPNPTAQMLYVKCENNTNSTIEISDLSGRVVKRISAIDNISKIDVTNFESGIYLIKYIDAQGKVAQKKFVKQD